MIKFLPSYVGSKAFWIDSLKKYEKRRFVELFCGSAVLSANLASECILNDKDIYIYKILRNFDKQIVPEKFTDDDYYKVRKDTNWWQYAFCLQKMSFSGVFRYSKNGYNVPCKSIKEINIAEDYQDAKKRWTELNPQCYNQDYYTLNNSIKEDDIVILDPPYERAQAAYNNKFDYSFYWEYLRLNENISKTVIFFDFEENMPFMTEEYRKTRVNGARIGNKERCFIFEESLKEGYNGEKIFANYYKEKLIWINEPYKPDFQIVKNQKFLELKSDYYDENKTPNFFFERFSKKEAMAPGGPWQALEKKCDIFAYFFVKSKRVYFFNTRKLVEKLNNIVINQKLVDIPNKTWITSGYKVLRESLSQIYKVKELI